MKKVLFLTTVLLASLTFKAQLAVTNAAPYNSPAHLVNNVLMGQGVTASNITFSGNTNQLGYFSNGLAGATNPLGLDSGIVLSSGNVNDIGGTGALSTSYNGPGDPDLLSIAQTIQPGITSSQDAAILEFDFVPQGDTVEFRFVFASDEYLAFINSVYNDIFAFFLSGPGYSGPYAAPAGFPNGATNLALVPGTTSPITISTIYVDPTETPPSMNGQYYINNPGSNTHNFNGYTTVISIKFVVTCNATYHFKFAVSDCNDGILDTGVFMEGGSFKSEAVLVDITSATGDSTVIEGCANADIKFTRPDTIGTHTVHFTIGGTATNGIDYNQIADSVTFASGIDTAILHIVPIADGNAEGQENISITVSTINACGDTIITTGNVYILDVPNMATLAPNHSPTCPSNTLPIYVQASGAMQPYAYVWTDSGGNPIGTNNDTLIVSGMVTDTFYVSTTDSCNLVTINDTIIVTVNGTLPVLQTSNDTTLNCPNHIINLSATASGGVPPYNFFWTPGGSGASVNVIPTQTTAYYITAADGCGNTTTDSVTATVNYTPVGLSLPNDTALTCPNLTHNVPVEATPTDGFGPFIYDWGSTSTDTTSLVNVSVNTDQSIYSVVTDFCGFTATDTMDISFLPYTPLSVTLLPVDSTCANENVSLLATALDGIAPHSFSWSEGSTGSPILFSSPIIGENNITVTVTDECSLQETADIIVNIMSCAVIVSNIFTPNGDGINDYFSIQGIQYFPNNHLTVLNRWGRKVFEKDTYQNDWDGKDLSEGVYFYTLELNNSANTIHKGAITLLK